MTKQSTLTTDSGKVKQVLRRQGSPVFVLSAMVEELTRQADSYAAEMGHEDTSYGRTLRFEIDCLHLTVEAIRDS